MNKNQFLLTTQKKETDALTKKIGSFYLYVGDGLEHNAVTCENAEIHLLGDIYDWKNPKLGNAAILEKLAKKADKDFARFVKASNRFAGEYIIIISINEKLYIFNDAAAQREINYTDDFLHFASQVKTLGDVTELIDHTDADAREFYDSAFFNKVKLHVTNATHKKNVTHLMPNHTISITDKKVKRVEFPKIEKRVKPEIVGKEVAKRLRGFMESIANRKTIWVGVTAGYDSRVLFLASLGIKNCVFFVNQNKQMSDDHPDVVVAKQLAAIYNRELIVNKKDWDEIDFPNEEARKAYTETLDFPRFINISINTKEDEVVVNGNVSEVGRNAYGTQKLLSAKALSFLKGSPDFKFANKCYTQWLKGLKKLKKMGYNELDLFYWEDRMSTWQAKTRTELYALGRNMVAPYNSRDLLFLMLTTKRKYRDMLRSRLYDSIIAELSDYKPEILELPINPSNKNKGIVIMKQLKVYDSYRRLKMNLEFIRKRS